MKALENKPARQLYEKVLGLISEPRPASSTELRGYKGYLRLRAGNFRVIYSVQGGNVNVVLIDNRGDDEVYRVLDRIL